MQHLAETVHGAQSLPNTLLERDDATAQTRALHHFGLTSRLEPGN